MISCPGPLAKKKHVANRKQHDAELSAGKSAGAADFTQVAKAYMAKGVKAYKDGDIRAAYENFDMAVKHNPNDAKEVLSALTAERHIVAAGLYDKSGTLFAKYPDANALAQADPLELEKMVVKTGFFRMKAKHLIGMAQAVHRRSWFVEMAG